jgi:hypothetical protein
VDEGVKISRSERAVHRQLADGAGVLLHLDSGAYYSLNGVALLIWDLLEESLTFGTLVERLRAEIPDAPATLSDDVADFVNQLRQRDLVTLETG